MAGTRCRFRVLKIVLGGGVSKCVRGVALCDSTAEEVAGGPAPGSCSAGRGHVTAVRRDRGPAAAARRGPGAYVVLGYRLGRREQRGSRRRVTQVTAARPTTAQNLFSDRSADHGRSCRGPGEVVLPPPQPCQQQCLTSLCAK